MTDADKARVLADKLEKQGGLGWWFVTSSSDGRLILAALRALDKEGGQQIAEGNNETGNKISR